MDSAKVEDVTHGQLSILADASYQSLVEQEEEIFERTYKYADLDIRYAQEADLFQQFLSDSIRVVMTTRKLTAAERRYFQDRNSYPQETHFATGAIAFIRNGRSIDTTYTYEALIDDLKNPDSGVTFVLENAKSGFSGDLIKLLELDALPSHIYALETKDAVLKYVDQHDQAIGIIDYSEISDSDSAYTKEVLQKIRLIGISRPVDSLQAGFIQPYQYNLQDRKYPFTRDLHFISKTARNDVGLGFASFLTGEIGQKIVLKAGLLPVYQSERNIEFKSTSDIKVVQ
jgi:phosphate transport system substrate-binding protein